MEISNIVWKTHLISLVLHLFLPVLKTCVCQTYFLLTSRFYRPCYTTVCVVVNPSNISSQSLALLTRALAKQANDVCKKNSGFACQVLFLVWLLSQTLAIASIQVIDVFDIIHVWHVWQTMFRNQTNISSHR